MSKDPEELELEALQRRLDDAFETTRPRRGFEDELWLRMQRRRPFGDRVRDFFGGLAGGIREAPGIPIATAALLLIVVVGVGLFSSGLSPFGGSHESMSASAPLAGGAGSKGNAAYSGGLIPTPALHPGLVPAPTGTQAGPTADLGSMPNNLYFGPANLSWTGTFPSDSPAAPVLIYAEPSTDQSRAAVNAFGPQQGVTITTQGSTPQLPREPVYVVSENSAGVAAGADPVAAADAFLSAHRLLPAWPDNVVVVQGGAVARVIYQRGFALPSGDTAFLVNWTGERYGIEVDIAGGRRTATGPLPLGLQNMQFPLISNGEAARLAVSEPPAATAAITPTPTVNLDHVELVYALAIAGNVGFYEPAYLFSGSVTYNGQTYVKRVLVPLVVASSRS